MDTSKLRKKDVRYVNEVVDYLTERELEVELGGSALKGDREYNDVDLLARGNPSAVTDVASGLMGLEARTDPFPRCSADGSEYRVEHVGGLMSYLDNQIDERFDIQAGDTRIDLCLKTQR